MVPIGISAIGQKNADFYLILTQLMIVEIFRLMDKLWLREGLDLKMVTFACVPTGHRHGMVELVTEAKTLREIQVQLEVFKITKARL